MTDKLTTVAGHADVVVRGSSAATYASAGGTLYFGLTLNEIGVVIGIVVTLATFAVNAVFQWRRDQREVAEYLAKQQEASDE